MIGNLTYTPSAYGGNGYARIDQQLRTFCSYTRHVETLNLGYMLPGVSGRLTQGGPLVPGPWTDSHADCVVIDNHGGNAGALSREQRRNLDVACNKLSEAAALVDATGRAGTLRDAARLAALAADPVLDVEIGDLFTLDGRLWQLRDDRRMAYPRLIELEFIPDSTSGPDTLHQLRPAPPEWRVRS